MRSPHKRNREFSSGTVKCSWILEIMIDMNCAERLDSPVAQMVMVGHQCLIKD